MSLLPQKIDLEKQLNIKGRFFLNHILILFLYLILLFYLVMSQQSVELFSTNSMAGDVLSIQIYLIILSLASLLSFLIITSRLKPSDHLIFVCAFVFYILAFSPLYYLFQSLTGIPFEFNAFDSLLYYNAHVDFENSGRGDFFSFISDQNFTFDDFGFTGYVHYTLSLFGENIFVQRVFNALFAAGSAVLTYRFCLRLFNGDQTRSIIAVSLLIFNNITIYFIASGLKECVMIFFVLLVFYHLNYVFTDKNKAKRLFYGILGIICLIFIRPHMLPFIFLGIFVVNYAKLQSLMIKQSILFLGVVIFGGVIYVVATSGAVEIITLGYSKILDPELQREIFNLKYEGYSIAEAYAVMFASISFGALSKIDFAITNEDTFLFSYNLLLLNYLAYYLWTSIRMVLKEKRAEFYGLLIFILIYAASMVVSFFAQEVRYLYMMYPFVYILIAYSIGRHKNPKLATLYNFGITAVIIFWNIRSL
ncbi:MAG: hypothetical protein COW03_14795 [Cytophagales bacterium CG12_big_fil_rev_8_21_14_0_65_40_12]|nr:MAG: hypothetical protein COW03_14795 [Cytophagales bacterium CG12_big_fil_rev_8_21_14_0_65_40_12]PIW04241.1 MAG: hypothetical protein COW40_10955 [Cytophagales bacterium CG17_big_fil_post_rev_8_21_14_2_50_40_13]